ncbi:endo-beta-mannanase [Mycolicibacterium chubuense NBB4]|uniref:Endo-beta-mannanase n=2 Tax=Mycolicibacterium chubuense TaxID=1800 RepID=I4BRD4_MYCCN|nr:endo-beta-mannanase [Mycolicibacterium chubuense NBB4]
MSGNPAYVAAGKDGRIMRRRTALKLPVLVTAGATLSRTPVASAEVDRWSADRAGRWYQQQGWLVGANFITSNAVNQLEMFQPGTFDPRRIDAELRLAHDIGLNAVRVFLHDQLWIQDHVGFLRRLGQFVDIAARHEIRPLFVLFDSCWDPHPRLGRQPEPRPGVHNSRWVQSPGADNLGDRRYRLVMHDYVVGVLTRFRGDDRVLGWDLWNEPDNPANAYRDVERKDKDQVVAALLPEVFRWARSVNPSQPLTSGVWDGIWGDPARRSEIAGIQLDNSDVITFHSYAPPAEFEARINELAPMGRPVMCTEYMARTLDCTVEGILPITKRHNVSAFSWGLVAGKTQTYLPWDTWEHPQTGPVAEWFHDLLVPGGQPYRDGEIHTIRDLTGRPRPS